VDLVRIVLMVSFSDYYIYNTGTKEVYYYVTLNILYYLILFQHFIDINIH